MEWMPTYVVRVVVFNLLNILLIHLHTGWLPQHVQQSTPVDHVPCLLAAEPTVKEHLVNVHVLGCLL